MLVRGLSWRLSFTLMIFVASTAAGQIRAEEAADAEIQAARMQFFEQKVRPILAEHCYACHGVEKQENGLRLDARGHLLRGGIQHGSAIVPGISEKSVLIDAINYRSLEMPPQAPLSPEAVRHLTQWVDMGAPWPEVATVEPHQSGLLAQGDDWWSLQPIREPSLPKVGDRRWGRGAIDRFILHRLETAGLTASAEASRQTLIRRVYFDLLGLPPTPLEVREFVEDSGADAFERLVDRVLSSPRYGERWGRHWLDLARYSDTKSYVDSGEPRYPFAYTYRDYVVSAFNSDLPFDRFVMQQIAADQLPPSEIQGPIYPDGLAALGFLTVGPRFNFFPHDIIDDRIDVVGRGLLGMTVSCARCHDHKFDPISTADYYGLYGIFANSEEPTPANYPRIGTTDTESKEFRDQVAAKLIEYDDYRTERRQAIQNEIRAWSADYLKFIVQQMPEHRTKSQPDVHPDRPIRERRAYSRGGVFYWNRYLASRSFDDPVFGLWRQLVTYSREDLPTALARLLSSLSESNSINRIIADAMRQRRPRTLVDVAAVYGELLTQAEDQWKSTQSADPSANLLQDPAWEQLRQVLYGPESPATMSLDVSEDYYTLDESVEVRKKFAEIERVFLKSEETLPRAMVITDRRQQVSTRIFLRGDPDRLGPDTERTLPTVFKKCSPEAVPGNVSGRLQLARFVIDRRNPLAARVFVNRVWAWHFGQGLVTTRSDFGTRGTPPSHPQLLDYLATQLVRHDWSIKQMHRMILMSRTWRQASVDRPDCRELDPENRLVWRMNRRRLDLEAMRDSLLAVGSHLDTSIGGVPSDAAPDEPEGTRRTMYLLVDRRDLPGMYRTFDFPSPDISAPRRSLTSVPGQALFLLNSPFVIAQAQRLADLAERHCGSVDLEQRVDWLSEVVFGRPASEIERELGRDYLRSGNDWIDYCQVLLQSNEFQFVD